MVVNVVAWMWWYIDVVVHGCSGKVWERYGFGVAWMWQGCMNVMHGYGGAWMWLEGMDVLVVVWM